jgi:hypothetical protein
MATPGKIEAKFETLLKNYPVFTKLPPHIKKYIDELNKDLKPGEPKNTPCCLQMSEGLNHCGDAHKIPPRSYRRKNPELPSKSGTWFLQAVDELEHHLADTYGAGEEIKNKSRMDAKKIKDYLKGRQGILLFREGYAGAHTELWDKTTVIQSAGFPGSAGAIISETYIWGRPRVVFWEVVGDPGGSTGVVPDWLPGWWEVSDQLDTYYYYFFPFGTVHYTRTEPVMFYCPAITNQDSGKFTVDLLGLINIKWNVGDYARESFVPLPVTSPPTLLGTYPDYPGTFPFNATKIA